MKLEREVLLMRTSLNMNEAELMRLTAELRAAVMRARSALAEGLREAQAVLAELKRARAVRELRSPEAAAQRHRT